MPYRLTPEVARSLIHLGERISLLRRARGWTQQEMAGRMGVGTSTLAQLEKGRPGVSVGAFARALLEFGRLEDLDDTAALERDEAIVAQGIANIPRRAKS